MTDDSIVLRQKTLSLRGEIRIHDDAGHLLAVASRPGVFSRSIELHDADGHRLFTVEPQPWKPEPTWKIDGQLGAFSIKRRKKSFERHYRVESGPLHGVIVEGGHHDSAFRIRREETILADAGETRFSLKNEHTIRLIDPSAQTRQLACLAGIIIMKDKQAARHDQ